MNIEEEEEVVVTTRQQQQQGERRTSSSTSISSRSGLKNVPLNERPFMVGVEATIKQENLLQAKYDLYQCLYVYRTKRQQVKGTLWSLLLEPLSGENNNNKLMALFLWENEKYQRANMMEGNSLGLQIQAYPLLETFPLFSFWVQLSGRVSTSSTSRRNNTNATPTSMATPTPMSMISETRNVRRISDGSTTSLTSTTTSCCCCCRRSLSSTRSIDSSLSQSDSCCQCNVCVTTTTTTTRCSSTSDVAIPEEETIVNNDDYTTTTAAAGGGVIGGKRRSLSEDVYIKDEAPVENAVTAAAASLSLSRKKIPKVVVESSTKFNEWNHGNELFVITKWRIPPSKQMMDYVYKHLKYVTKIATSSTCNNNCLQHDVYLINNADDPNVIMEFSIWTSNQNNEESINGSLSSRSTCNTDAHEWFLSLPPVKKIYKGLQEMIISYNKRISSISTSSSNSGEMNFNNEQLSPCTCTMTYWKQMSSSPSKPISIVPSSMN